MKIKSQKHNKSKKGAWFVPLRGSYIPVSWQGWLTYIPYLLLILLGFWTFSFPLRTCISNECSISTIGSIVTFSTIYLVPYFVALVVIMQWIAKRKS